MIRTRIRVFFYSRKFNLKSIIELMTNSLMSGEYRLNIVLKEIGRRVKMERNKKHMTQPQLAKAAGLSVSFLSNIESGRQSMNLRALISIVDE